MNFVRRYYAAFLIIISIFYISNLKNIKIEEHMYYLIGLTVLIIIPQFVLRKSLSIYLISSVMIVIMIFQTIDSRLHTALYADSIRTNDSILLDLNLRKEYLVCCLIYYLIFSITVLLYNKIFIHKKIRFCRNIISIKISPKINVYIVAVVWALVRFLIQRKYHLLYPGQAAIVTHSGVFVYAIRIVTLFIWAFSLGIIIARNRTIKSYLIKGITLALICGAPQAVLGSRGEILLFFLNVMIIFVFCYCNGKYNKGLVLIFMLLIVAIGLFSVYFAYYIRTGTTINVFSFLTIRLVGFVDGINVIKYINSGGSYLPAINFFKALISADDTLYISTFYTHYICGYPMDKIHSWAIPGFASGLLYLGPIGLVIIALLHGVITAFLEDKILLNILNSEENIFYFVSYVYLYLSIFVSAIMEGNIDRIGNYIIVCLVVFVINCFISFKQNEVTIN